jgi:hypothetical protein
MRRLVVVFALLFGLPVLGGCIPFIGAAGNPTAGFLQPGVAGKLQGNQWIPPATRIPKDTLGGGPTT